ncbi:asparagine synthase-related protein [Rhodospirillum rubrum]|uniref:asparagine synthase-related protein n=1 Tax=Rhodospirillum rubrum TaxID=1085 RepID=UPI00003C2C51|nr:asparagine synthetase B family protein [Rhodospirillum rubrum]AEO47792.1 asparagine synthase [Rhodospirillum rubrum F11]QXG81732.1 asparagine synthetase B family protein [Rhodospirillum rubrum]
MFSGYLFDRERLARKLGGDHSWPDVRLAAAWIAHHGLDRLADLAGDYALSHWDPGARRLFLAVAPMGSRLLYWHRVGTICHFATTVAGLHRIPDIPRVVDPLHLTARFSAMVGDPTRTVYKDIHQIVPGDMLVADVNANRYVPLWRPDAERRLRLANEREYLEAADELLERAVARRLQAAHAPAFLSSGGLDSAAMLTTASRLAGDRKVRSYTIVPSPGLCVTADRGWYGDERAKVADLAASHTNLDIRLCHSLVPSPLETNPAHLFMATGLPCMIANQIGWLDIAFQQMQQAGHDAVLSGQSGNFTFSYDGNLCFADLIREGRPLTALRLLAQVARYKQQGFAPMVRHRVVVPLLPDAFYYGQRRWRGRPHPLADRTLTRPGWREKVGLDDYLADHGEQPFQERDSRSRQQIIHFMLKRRAMTLPNAHALETVRGTHYRDVYADRDLLEFILAIPRDQFILDGRNRSLARRLLAMRGVPDSIVNERAIGQQRVDWNHRMTPQLEAYAADLDSFSQDGLIAEMLDLPKMRHMLATWPKTDHPHETMRLSHGFVFANAMQMGRFVRWANGGNQ